MFFHCRFCRARFMSGFYDYLVMAAGFMAILSFYVGIVWLIFMAIERWR